MMISTFLYSLAGGMLLILATGRPDQIAWKFLRLMGLLVFALAAVNLTWALRAAGWRSGQSDDTSLLFAGVLALGAVGVVMIAPLASRHRIAFRLFSAVGGLAGLTAACTTAFTGLGETLASPLAQAMVIISQMLGGLLLGSITIAWLLGHAYLTATKMTIAPLRHFSRLLSWAIAMRCLFLLCSLAIAWIVGSGGEAPFVLALQNSWLVLTMRVGVGLVAVGVFAYLVSDCVRLRATQSATGILYFASIFAYVGELASQQFVLECGWPL